MSKCLCCGKEFTKSQVTDLLCPECYEKQIEETRSIESSKIDDKKVTNHPSRYNGNSEYECYKVLKNWLTPEQYKGFLLGNALKYQCRLGKKDDEIQEINKAEWYLEELKNTYNEESDDMAAYLKAMD